MTPERFEELKAHWAKMKAENGFNFWGWDEAVAHIDALQSEVDATRAELAEARRWDAIEPQLLEKLKHEANNAGLRDDVVDKDDRVTLLRCAIFHAKAACESADEVARLRAELANGCVMHNRERDELQAEVDQLRATNARLTAAIEDALHAEFPPDFDQLACWEGRRYVLDKALSSADTLDDLRVIREAIVILESIGDGRVLMRDAKQSLHTLKERFGGGHE